MANNYVSGALPKSSIIKSTFHDRLSSFYGFRQAGASNLPTSALERRTGIKFVKVDLSNNAYRVQNASLGNVFDSRLLSSKLEKYFDAWMSETSLAYDDIADRQSRLNELSFMQYNEPFVSRVVQLVADEATNLDEQDRLITVSSPNSNFIEKCYELLSQWGVTQQRIHGVMWDLELYGEAFWTQKVTQRGVERIFPSKVNQILERLEFSPLHMAEFLAQKEGFMSASKNRGAKVEALLDQLKNKDDTFDIDENFSDMFDSKLLGYEFHNNNYIPPWDVTHFRFNADHSEFYPYGRPPLLSCLAPFKQLFATMTLQGIARTMAFPVTIYKVKSVDGMNPAMSFDYVNEVKEEYDNLGVTPASTGGEVYSINTKMWVPEGLLDVQVIKSEVEIDAVEDISIFQDRVAVATGIPKGYLIQDDSSWGTSAVALIEQCKPFARHVFAIQSAFLDGLGELLRLHFAITGEFDYDTPFTLSMRFPSIEMSDDKRESRTSSLELTKSVIDFIKDAIGMSEDDLLPSTVVTDIMTKYSFLDPTDIMKWIKLSGLAKLTSKANDDDSEEEGEDDFDFDFGDDGGSSGGAESNEESGDDSGSDDFEISDADTEQLNDSIRRKEYKRRLYEKKKRKHSLKVLKEARLKEISKRYNECKQDLYFAIIEKEHLTEWKGDYKHHRFIDKITPNSQLYDSIQVLSKKEYKDGGRLKESVSSSDMIYDDFDDKPIDESIDTVLNDLIGN